MRRRLIGLTTGLSLALCAGALLGAGAAQADGPGDWGAPVGPSGTPAVAVFGTIVSVNQAQGSFVADAYLPAGDQGQGDDQARGDQGPGDDQGQSDQGTQSQGTQSQGQGTQSQGQGTQSQGGQPGSVSNDWIGHDMQPWGGGATQVTITTSGSTTVEIDGQSSSASQLSQGDRFVAMFSGSPGDSLQTLTANPALAVYAHTPPAEQQLYAFVGSVTTVTPGTGGMGTVTVQVTSSVPSGLVPAGSNPATFTVSADTLVLGGSTVNGLFGGSLNDVHVGDVVAGGLIGSSGETLAQVEASPLQALIDFPAATTPTSTATASQTRARALEQALALFGYHSHSRRTKHRNHHRHVRHHAHGRHVRHHHATRRHGVRR